jgi:putative ABC transport system substrate-binding protein
VASLAHPGGNITGVENNSEGIWGKRFEILKDALPQSAHVAFLVNPTNPAFTQSLPRLETEAQALGVHLQLVAVRHPDALAIGEGWAIPVTSPPDFQLCDHTRAPHPGHPEANGRGGQSDDLWQ